MISRADWRSSRVRARRPERLKCGISRLENRGLEDGGLDDLESQWLVDITDDGRSGVLILGAGKSMIVQLGSVLSFGLNVHHRFL
jgi:hypothetical protein